RNAEARRAYCELEVTLNRRLAEGTYLRVVPVVAAAGGLRVDGTGEAVDTVVEMRRLPDGASLADVGRSSSLGDADLAAIVRKLDRKSTRLNSSHVKISYAVFCLKKK